VKVAFHVDQLWFRAPGGIGTYVEQLWRGFDRAHEVDLVPFFSRWRDRSPRFAPLTTDGRFPGVEIPWGFRILYPMWVVARRPRLPRSLEEARIVHATNHAAIPPVRVGQRLVVTIHDLSFERFPELFPATWRWLYRRGLRVAIEEAAALIVPSESVRSELVDAGARQERITVIPLASSFGESATGGGDAFDPEREDLADRGIVPPYVLAAGTVEPRKNLVRLVGAYRRLAADGLPHALVLIGPEGWGSADLRAVIDRGGPGTIVRAQVGGPLLERAYADADAVAYVSLYEGFGLPVLEAMSVGTPVVTSDVSSLPEVAGDAALLVDPTDEDAIADALRRVLTDPALREELARRGRERAGRYSWDTTTRATLDLYREVAG
jgi:glycosyltransferase involved in cell wall biosynthesis